MEVHESINNNAGRVKKEDVVNFSSCFVLLRIAHPRHSHCG
jgi:hypothetical protein